MNKISLSAMLLIATSLGGCLRHDQPLTPAVNPSLYSVHQPVVGRADYVFDVGAGGNGVSAGEQARLAAWFDSLQLRYGDRVSLDAAAGYAAPQARQDIAAVAGSYGLLLSDAAPITAGDVPPGAIRVVVSRTTATVPGCPSWPQEENANARTSSNYGCATNSNLAAMIANPEDLVRGQSGVVDDPGELSRAVGTYRTRKQTGISGKLKAEKTGGN